MIPSFYFSNENGKSELLPLVEAGDFLLSLLKLHIPEIVSIFTFPIFFFKFNSFQFIYKG